MHPIHQALRKGNNSISVLASGPVNLPEKGNLFVEARITLTTQEHVTVKSDESWRYVPTTSTIKENRLKAVDRKELKKVVVLKETPALKSMTQSQSPLLLSRATSSDNRPVRASLMKSSFLMRSLGRPNREQIVSMRPSDLTTLEAMDLSNGQSFADLLSAGAKKWSKEFPDDSKALVLNLYRRVFTRSPTSEELALGFEMLGEKPDLQAVEDLLWAMFMSPEFQFIR
jgi:hypothetical protein